ncbi:ABC transporter ATP-binding protein [Sporolactobacillus putidus]|uniref:Macrolide ABC transporter ATP-binding protein n=1 Tax=Sporolactobacillus putidus TaxID=492735 RepID=A0A917S1R0_9BACL|nr:ABC transporter ATP-binding protein [Sporolactobacillus putidus]GGL51012.1 macrolide ABC transporter ATP-binding protein [Sporolactobacillus putidus]
MKKAIVKTDKLCKSYILGKNGVNVLKNLNLEIFKGDFTVIMGPSGSGKSTLLYALSTMDRPTSGTVEILGRNIARIPDKEIPAIRKKDISFVFQSANLLPDLTAFENVAFCGYGGAPKAQVNEKTKALLTRFGLAAERDKYPSEMSGGQQQRVAIARALIGKPQVIFCDEPTGALNSAAGLEVLDILSQLVQAGQSIVMVTHDLKAAARASRLVYLSDGRIEGDLLLGSYDKNEQVRREETIFAFLQQHGW